MVEINYDEIFYSNKCGPFKFIEGTKCVKSNRIYIEIIFLNTNYRKLVDYNTALKGLVRDPYAPLLCGVGAFGIPKRKYKNKELYCWQDMIRRCYENLPKHNAYYNKISVCDRWKCFEYFLDDIVYLDGYNEWIMQNNYHLDKDKLQQNIPHDQRIYSSQTCIFISNEENNIIRTLENNNNGMYGIEITPSGSYCVRIDGKYYGKYSNPIAAVTMHNFYYKLNHNFQLNQSTNMSVYEALQYKKYKSGKEPIVVCQYIN